jgi:hypothetical protein
MGPERMALSTKEQERLRVLQQVEEGRDGLRHNFSIAKRNTDPRVQATQTCERCYGNFANHHSTKPTTKEQLKRPNSCTSYRFMGNVTRCRTETFRLLRWVYIRLSLGGTKPDAG